jgi:hypothetical protein
VLVAGCLEGGCHFLEGNLRAKRRTEHLRDMLDETGVGRERLGTVNLSAAMAPTCVSGRTGAAVCRSHLAQKIWRSQDELAIPQRNGVGPTILGRAYQGSRMSASRKFGEQELRPVGW